MKISSVKEMREMDRTAIEKFGIMEEILMENAGQGACDVLSKETGIQGKTFLIFCGIGNNGGDGLVIARKLHSYGAKVKVWILSDPGKYKGAARRNFEIASGLPIDVKTLDSVNSTISDISHCDIIIDGIFGTGLLREVDGKYREIIDLINKSGKKVLSVDIPSGIHGDTGQIMGIAVKADWTVTFGLPKIGNMLFPGYSHCGKLYVSYISFPQSLYKSDDLKISINIPAALQPRDENGHKSSFGDVLFIAGARGYFGAPYFAAYSFLKAGGGYSRLAAPKSIIPFIACKGSEIVFVPQAETISGSLAFENKNALAGLSRKTDMTVLGPGLSLDEEVQALAEKLAGEIETPLLIDGDGVTAVCRNIETIKQRKAATILTPHMVEMFRLTGISVEEIEADKIGILQKTARNLNAIIVLKGAHSLIGFPDERVYINMSGNSGMATAGSGDVLAGTIAGMFGLGMNIEEAVRMGVFIHGLSGDLAAAAIGRDGMSAQDIMDYLPLAMKTAREDHGKILNGHYSGACVV